MKVDHPGSQSNTVGRMRKCICKGAIILLYMMYIFTLHGAAVQGTTHIIKPLAGSRAITAIWATDYCDAWGGQLTDM